MAQFLDALAGMGGWLLSLHWLLAGAANALILYLMAHLLVYSYREHSYLYQFDDKARTFDAWVDLVMPLVKRIRLKRYRSEVSLRLSRAGTRRNWDANHFIASQILLTAFVGITSFVLLKTIMNLPLYLPLSITVTALIFPYIKLCDVAAARFNACNRDLPFFIDYLSLAMGAGLDFNQALRTVVNDAPPSPLSREFEIVLRNMRLGMSRADALLEMDRRLDSPSLKLFVQTLVQGMELGTDIVQTLTAMSETMQMRRFQRAEEAAGKISVRMMIPMMCFVMPAVMIVLLGPMILTYVNAG